MAAAALGLALLAAGPVAAQASAAGRATISIGEVMSLEVRPGGAVASVSPDGAYIELPQAVELSVLSNRAWQLHVVVADAGTVGSAAAVSSGGGDGSVWWRVSGDAGAGATGYRPAERQPSVVASGPRGRATVALDYRWLAEAGAALSPGTRLHFMLSPL